MKDCVENYTKDDHSLTKKTASHASLPGSYEEGIITPRKRKTDPLIGQDALMALIGTDLTSLVRLQGPDTLVRCNMDFFKLYRSRNHLVKPISLSGPFLGAPQAVMGLEKLIALGAKRIWVLGWCGSLQSDLKIGDMVIPLNCIIEEGTSQHYPIKGPPRTDSTLNRLLESALTIRNHPHRKGKIWTTDAPYRETPSKVSTYRELGVLAVEMEMSALMTVAIFRKVRLAALLIVSDELSDLSWRHGFHEPRFKEATTLAATILLDLLVNRAGHQEDLAV